MAGSASVDCAFASESVLLLFVVKKLSEFYVRDFHILFIYVCIEYFIAPCSISKFINHIKRFIEFLT